MVLFENFLRRFSKFENVKTKLLYWNLKQKRMNVLFFFFQLLSRMFIMDRHNIEYGVIYAICLIGS